MIVGNGFRHPQRLHLCVQFTFRLALRNDFRSVRLDRRHQRVDCHRSRRHADLPCLFPEVEKLSGRRIKSLTADRKASGLKRCATEHVLFQRAHEVHIPRQRPLRLRQLRMPALLPLKRIKFLFSIMNLSFHTLLFNSGKNTLPVLYLRETRLFSGRQINHRNKYTKYTIYTGVFSYEYTERRASDPRLR